MAKEYEKYRCVKVTKKPFSTDLVVNQMKLLLDEKCCKERREIHPITKKVNYLIEMIKKQEKGDEKI